MKESKIPTERTGHVSKHNTHCSVFNWLFQDSGDYTTLYTFLLFKPHNYNLNLQFNLDLCTAPKACFSGCFTHKLELKLVLDLENWSYLEAHLTQANGLYSEWESVSAVPCAEAAAARSPPRPRTRAPQRPVSMEVCRKEMSGRGLSNKGSPENTRLWTISVRETLHSLISFTPFKKGKVYLNFPSLKRLNF